MTIKKESRSGVVVYTKNGKLHRLEGSSLIYCDGSFSNFINDKRHRIEGPAVKYLTNGACFFYHHVNGNYYKKELFKMKYKPCVLKDGILS